jgi:nucleotide-binding universal stress UspA family protein
VITEARFCDADEIAGMPHVAGWLPDGARRSVPASRRFAEQHREGSNAMTENSTKPIVVGIDGSPYSRAALRWALDEGARRDCAVQAITIAHAAPITTAGRPGSAGVMALPSSAPDQKYLLRLERTVRDVLGEHDDPRLTAELLQGSPPEALCAASGDAQLLVLGSHGHGRLLDAVLGSVAQYCVRHAVCPVVVIPRQLAEPPASDGAAETDRPEALSHGLGPLL